MLNIEMTVDNIGVAPPYRAYIPVFEIREAGRWRQNNVLTRTETGWNVLTWLPGRYVMNTKIKVPETAKQGRYLVYFALIDPYSMLPVIRLAVDGRDAQGWYSWSSLEIVEKGMLETTLTGEK
jgi:hypothetical protein